MSKYDGACKSSTRVHLDSIMCCVPDVLVNKGLRAAGGDWSEKSHHCSNTLKKPVEHYPVGIPCWNVLFCPVRFNLRVGLKDSCNPQPELVICRIYRINIRFLVTQMGRQDDIALSHNVTLCFSLWKGWKIPQVMLAIGGLLVRPGIETLVWKICD